MAFRLSTIAYTANGQTLSSSSVSKQISNAPVICAAIKALSNREQVIVGPNSQGEAANVHING